MAQTYIVMALKFDEGLGTTCLMLFSLFLGFILGLFVSQFIIKIFGHRITCLICSTIFSCIFFLFWIISSLKISPNICCFLG